MAKLSFIYLICSHNSLIHLSSLLFLLILPNITFNNPCYLLVLNIYCSNPKLIFLSLPSTVCIWPNSLYTAATSVYIVAPRICLYYLQLLPLLLISHDNQACITSNLTTFIILSCSYLSHANTTCSTVTHHRCLAS